MYNAMQAFDAVMRHDSIFFDEDLNPVIPQPGEYFVEYEEEEFTDNLLDRAMVQYVGPDNVPLGALSGFAPPRRQRHLVLPEYQSSPRSPKGVLLIRM